MTPEQFNQYAEQGYTHIPITREVLADLDTPLSAYLKLANAPYSYLFESVHGGEQWGRYSIIGLPCHTRISVRGFEITIIQDGQADKILSSSDPLEWLRDFSSQFKVPELKHLPRFTGGLVGYFGYETIHFIEPTVHCEKYDPLGVPDILLMVSEEVLVFDTLRDRLLIVTHAHPNEPDAYYTAQKRLDDLVTQLRKSILPIASRPSSSRSVKESEFVSGFTQEGYENGVRRIKDYIIEGDVMQVVLSQRMSIPYSAPPLDLYRALRGLNPSPYLYYLNLQDFYIVGSSPEILVRLEDGLVTVRPIAGTRRRGKTHQEDMQLEKELLSDPKEIAEHVMLIDLGRNDTGRVAQSGTVQVTDQMIVERYSHVMHIVSNVTGRLCEGKDAFDVLKATFPAGTVSGAPKIRAMEILSELEPVKRGVYSGAIGYIAWSGNLDTAIAIRTALIQNGILYVQAGAGIVHDSVPQKEWEETLSKGRALFRAVALAEAGLEGESL